MVLLSLNQIDFRFRSEIAMTIHDMIVSDAGKSERKGNVKSHRYDRSLYSVQKNSCDRKITSLSIIYYVSIKEILSTAEELF